MKVYKVKILGIDDVNIKDKQTGKVTKLYRYYINVGNASLGGIKTDVTYGKDLIKSDTINVINFDNKYKVIEIE